ncbi:MAG: tetratricopeptide repeat protein [Erythrobacter sp.]
MFPLSTLAAAGLAVAVTATVPVHAQAQEQTAESRLRKIEAEIRALQRQVFPGGDTRFFEPEISTAQPQQNRPATSAPSTTAVTDILARLDALEAQLQQLTASAEESRNAVALLEERMVALEGGAAAPASATAAPGEAAKPAATETNLASMTGAPARPAAELPAVRPAAELPAATTRPATTAANATPTPAPAAAAPAGPSAERLAGVQAILKPQTGDAGEDEYSYGFRLWEARFYPEAQQQLSLFLEKYPSHPRTTFARNLLGRAYLDDGKPREAAPWFLRNYQADKQAARAGDSLLFLAEAMIALNDTNRACIALAEFAETYPALASGRLLSQYDANRQKVKCN